jgi:hypothetical protein
MSEEEIKLDRYAKFRRLGLFEEYVVKGSDWKNARAEREQVPPRCCCCRPQRSTVLPRVLSQGRRRVHVQWMPCLWRHLLMFLQC